MSCSAGRAACPCGVPAGLRPPGCAGTARPGNRAGEGQTPGRTSSPSIFVILHPAERFQASLAWQESHIWLAHPSPGTSGCRSLMGTGWGQAGDRLGTGESQPLPCAEGANPLSPNGPNPRGWQEQQGAAAAAPLCSLGCRSLWGLGSNTSQKDNCDTLPIPGSVQAGPGGDHRITKSQHGLGGTLRLLLSHGHLPPKQEAPSPVQVSWLMG